jgi:hypothetical protein
LCYRCLTKVEVQEIVEPNQVETCQHSYSKECHTTFVTTYTPTQVRWCCYKRATFKKSTLFGSLSFHFPTGKKPKKCGKLANPTPVLLPISMADRKLKQPVGQRPCVDLKLLLGSTRVFLFRFKQKDAKQSETEQKKCKNKLKAGKRKRN